MAANAVLSPTAKRRPISWGNPLTYALALAVAAVSITPVVYVIVGGFRTTPQIVADPAGLPTRGSGTTTPGC